MTAQTLSHYLSMFIAQCSLLLLTIATNLHMRANLDPPQRMPAQNWHLVLWNQGKGAPSHNFFPMECPWMCGSGLSK